MEYLRKDDLFKVIETSIIGNDDVDVITRLYQPLIGFKSLSLYMTFLTLKNNDELFTHEYIYGIMQINPTDFILARKNLEAVGLLKSYKYEDSNKFIYQILPPLKPSEFFNDYLFKNMLIKYVGEEVCLKLASIYKFELNLDKYKEITTPFVEVFSLNFDNDVNQNLLDKINLKNNKPVQIVGMFTNLELINKLKEKTQIAVNSISEYEINEIIRISTLYGIKLEDAIGIVDECFDPKRKYGSKINLDELNKKASDIVKFTSIDIKNKKKNLTPIIISGKSKLADEFDLINNLSSREYLSCKQDGAPVANADLKILNVLSKEYKLSTSLVNVLIYYGLKECNNILNQNYLTKVAGSLKREKIDNPIDALNYLEGSKSSVTNKIKLEKTAVKENKEIKNNDDENDEEYEEALKFLRGKK